MSDRARNERGELLCEDCRGTKEEEVVLGHPNDPAAPLATRACSSCKGEGTAPCCGCAAPAKVEGADGLFVYCSVACAWADDNWPGCLRCQAEPQDPLFGPFCSGTCEDAMLTAIQRRKLGRWQASLAGQPDASAEA